MGKYKKTSGTRTPYKVNPRTAIKKKQKEYSVSSTHFQIYRKIEKSYTTYIKNIDGVNYELFKIINFYKDEDFVKLCKFIKEKQKIENINNYKFIFVSENGKNRTKMTIKDIVTQCKENYSEDMENFNESKEDLEHQDLEDQLKLMRSTSETDDEIDEESLNIIDSLAEQFDNVKVSRDVR